MEARHLQGNTAGAAAPRTTGRPRPARADTRRPRRGAPLLLDLALQGGGAHGAFTWGVLDRLLEHEGIEIAGVSGTSAGALNAVALAAGLMEGGRDGARQRLRAVWERVGRLSPFQAAHADAWGGWTLPWLTDPSSVIPAAWPGLSAWTEPWRRALVAWGSVWSPYQLNPLNLNPLRTLLAEVVDFDRVRGCHKTRLFIAATHVRTGNLRIFRQHELTPDVVMASACLPLLFQAVEIDGEPYWDGGYAGNPSLLPLVEESPAADLLLVQINPSLRCEHPVRAGDILDRLNEITFNASLLKELRAIALLQAQARLLGADPGRGRSARRPPDPRLSAAVPAVDAPAALLDRMAALRLHRVEGGMALAALGASSKLRTDPAFLGMLHAQGRAAMDRWLAVHGEALGRRGTLDPALAGGLWRAEAAACASG